MGYELLANTKLYPKEDIWRCIRKVCLELNSFIVVEAGGYFFKLNYKNNDNSKWGYDLYIELSENFELYILFNLSIDEKIILQIKEEFYQNKILIYLEEI